MTNTETDSHMVAGVVSLAGVLTLMALRMVGLVMKKAMSAGMW